MIDTITIVKTFSTIIFTEFITRCICPNSYLRPSNLINKITTIIRDGFYYLGNKLAFLLDYMSYIHIIRFLEKIFKNIHILLQKFFVNLTYYLKQFFKNFYYYTPIKDIVILFKSSVNFIISFTYFFKGFYQYFKSIASYLYGGVRIGMAIFIIIIISISMIFYFTNLSEIFIENNNTLPKLIISITAATSLILISPIFEIIDNYIDGFNNQPLVNTNNRRRRNQSPSRNFYDDLM